MVRQTVTANNQAPVVEIFIWLTLVFSILTVITRLSIKMRVVHKTGVDDIAIAISLVSFCFWSIGSISNSGSAFSRATIYHVIYSYCQWPWNVNGPTYRNRNLHSTKGEAIEYCLYETKNSRQATQRHFCSF
jgi:hypothetical protein